jgi:hypothetical protein
LKCKNTLLILSRVGSGKREKEMESWVKTKGLRLHPYQMGNTNYITWSAKKKKKPPTSLPSSHKCTFCILVFSWFFLHLYVYSHSCHRKWKGLRPPLFFCFPFVYYYIISTFYPIIFYPVFDHLGVLLFSILLIILYNIFKIQE